MANDSIDVVEIFCSYSHKDEELKKELEAHLSGMKRQGLITLWSDRQIEPGTGWKEEIDSHFESAEVILLLISADFIASDYCYEQEMMSALKRDKKGEDRTIPIILRPVDWKSLPFSYLQALPTDAKPITTWDDRDEAFTDVALGVRKVVEKLRNERIKHPIPDEVHWTLSLQGTIDRIDYSQVKTILSTLRGYVGNTRLQFQRVEKGSIVCAFVGSREGFRIIQSKIESRELIWIAELGVEAIQEFRQNGEIDEKLTPREIEVLGLVAEGLSDREMAERLVIAESTAKNHIRSILEKLGAKNRTHAVKMARDIGLLH